MMDTLLAGLRAQIATRETPSPVGRVTGVMNGVVTIDGLGRLARIGDQVRLVGRASGTTAGEIVQLNRDHALALPDYGTDGVALGDRAALAPKATLAPCDAWLGRVVDPGGRPLDGLPLMRGAQQRDLAAAPPRPAQRRPLGERLATGLNVTNTFLPLVEGQRIGLFAGSGVGKSSLIGQLAKGVAADVVVVALIGERGREVRHFVEETLGPEGLKRAVVVAATSDQSPLLRRRCALAAMTVAEHFRDTGRSVLLLADSITRFAEAHREVAIAAGEAPVLRGFPPSTASQIMSLCERAGPGEDDQGDITALFSVLVAGSDMEEPVADILRGVLDGHIVLDREIAERGRFPAIDVLRSVSRSLPWAATEAENGILREARRLLALHAQNAVMIRAGLYSPGADQTLDQAVALHDELEGFLGQPAANGCTHSFQQLELILRRARSGMHASTRHGDAA